MHSKQTDKMTDKQHYNSGRMISINGRGKSIQH